MRLLVLTQAVDENDLYLGFFTRWLAAFSPHFASIEVICLKEGAHALPANIRVHSLGKERGAGRLRYVWNFYRLAWALRGSYDAVLVHMNQEYVLLGGLLWAALGKSVHLWRNHYAGSALTDLSARFCRKVFYTSKSSFTAKYAHAVRMPVGVEIERFSSISASRTARSILFFGRFAPSKRPHVFVAALKKLRERNVAYSASVIGSPLPKDEAYEKDVRQLASGMEHVSFRPGVPHDEAAAIFAAHELFIDLGSSGMYNKTLFEAAAAGCLVISASRDFQEEIGERFGVKEDDAASVAGAIETVLAMTDEEKHANRERLKAYAQRNSLSVLSGRLAQELK